MVSFTNLRGLLPGTLPLQTDRGGPYWWPPNDLKVRSGPPNEGLTRAVARRFDPALPAMLDIESWVLCNGKPAWEEYLYLSYFVRVATWVRQEKPGLKFGFWNVPGTTGWANIHARNEWWTYCTESHRRLRPLAEHVDMVMPAFYATDEQWWPWRRSAEFLLDLYRQMGRPIWCFISPRVYENGEPKRLLPDDALAMQLEFLTHQQVDAAVIWDPVREPFLPDAPWWRSAQRFIPPP